MFKGTPFALAIVLGVTASAEADTGTLVTWRGRVYDILGPHTFEVSPRGGKIPHTGFTGCEQEPVRVFRDKEKNLQEEVRVTCKVGIGAEVQLIETCYVSRPDQSFGALKVKDSINEFTVSLACQN
jgi:hypothetical protein